MNPELLATQIRIPPQARQTLPRPRLVAALENSLAASKLVLVAAPAGYGKTTFLAQWAHLSQYPVAWLALSEAENDLERFFRYFYSAWEQVQPGIRESPLGVMLEGSMPPAQPLISAFINTAHALPDHLAFVLDDYHLIDNPLIHEALAYLLDHLPRTAHLILVTRTDPPLPVARYRARAELIELGMDDLQFRPEETQAFANQLLDLDLSPEEVENLQQHLEGWPAGLRLAGLAIQNHPTRLSEPLITGRHRYVADYLSQDVLAGLPKDLIQFLLQTSILDSLSAPLCNAVTGQEDSQALLERLERKNLFLVPLDENRQWYRYHRIFADFLRAELLRRTPEQAPGLHRQAAEWFLNGEFPEQAYTHALAGGDLELMGTLFGRYANARVQAGEFSALKRWLDGLPEAWYTAYPALGLARAGYLAFTGSFEECLRVVDDVESSLELAQTENARQQLAGVQAVRCFIACTLNDLPQAEAFAGKALQGLPAEDLGFRPVVYAALGDTYRKNGLWEQARQSYLKALGFAHAPAMRVSSAHIYGALADLDLTQGRLHDAAGHWRKALRSLQAWESWGSLPLPVIGWIYIRAAEILYEWNDLAPAAEHLARGMERAALGGDIRTQLAGTILGVRLYLAQGDLEQAASTLAQARLLAEQAPFPEWTARFERCQVDLWLAQNQLRPAAAWAGALLESGGLQDRQDSDVLRLAVCRVLIGKGERLSIRQALELLDEMLPAAQAGGWAPVAIETLALQALAQAQLGENAKALTALEHALRLAEPEGYLRLFVDLGLPMGRLLQEARSRGVMPPYVEQLLSAFDRDLSGPSGLELPERLTPREQEILALLAAGLTNREIAEQVVISPETVKKHVGSIIGKLGASNRTEAVARARALGLLE